MHRGNVDIENLNVERSSWAFINWALMGFIDGCLNHLLER